MKMLPNGSPTETLVIGTSKQLFMKDSKRVKLINDLKPVLTFILEN